MFCIQDFNQIYDLQILSVCGLSYCLNSIFERATVFSFDWSSIYFFPVHAFCVLRNLCLIQSHRSFPFRSMIQFEMIFVYVVKVSIEVYIYPEDSPAYFCWFSFPCGINFPFCWKFPLLWKSLSIWCSAIHLFLFPLPKETHLRNTTKISVKELSSFVFF